MIPLALRCASCNSGARLRSSANDMALMPEAGRMVSGKDDEEDCKCRVRASSSAAPSSAVRAWPDVRIRVMPGIEASVSQAAYWSE